MPLGDVILFVISNMLTGLTVWKKMRTKRARAADSQTHPVPRFIVLPLQMPLNHNEALYKPALNFVSITTPVITP